jgi:hypothetical protein
VWTGAYPSFWVWPILVVIGIPHGCPGATFPLLLECFAPGRKFAQTALVDQGVVELAIIRRSKLCDKHPHEEIEPRLMEVPQEIFLDAAPTEFGQWVETPKWETVRTGFLRS